MYKSHRVAGNRGFMTTRGSQEIRPLANLPTSLANDIIKIITSCKNRDGTSSYQIKWKTKPSSWLKQDRVPQVFMDNYNMRANKINCLYVA